MTPKQKNILLITLAILFIVGIGITLLIVLKPHKNTTEITTMASEPCCSWDGGKTSGGDYCNQSEDICKNGCFMIIPQNNQDNIIILKKDYIVKILTYSFNINCYFLLK